MKISYQDFWPNFVSDVKSGDKEWYFGQFLPKLFNIKINDKNPDILIFSIFGDHHKRGEYKNCRKVYYSAENMSRNFPRFEKADYTISHHIAGEGSFGEAIDEETHLRMPIYLRVFGPDKMRDFNSGFDVEKVFDEKENFCCLVTRHESAKVRGKIFKNIHNNYKEVDSAGKGWNTMENNWTVPGEWIDLKKFASKYKFMIAAENRSVIGYCSEKLYNALRCKTVPIYWGDPRVDEMFNSDAFINFSNFDDTNEFVDYIEYLDNNDEAYKSILKEDPLPCAVEDHPVYNKEKIKNKTQKFFR